MLKLHIALNNIDKLNENISAGNHNLNSTNNIEDEHELREKLKDKLLSIYHKNGDMPLSKTILDSDVYNKLLEYIKDEKIISHDDIFWEELEETIIKSSPDFKNNLQLLVQSHLTTIDYHTALLIKCHIQPSQMAILLGRTRSAIVSRRATLSIKIFGEKIGTKVIDHIIRLL